MLIIACTSLSEEEKFAKERCSCVNELHALTEELEILIHKEEIEKLEEFSIKIMDLEEKAEECIKNVEKKYQKLMENDEFENVMKEILKKHCPHVFEGVEE